MTGEASVGRPGMAVNAKIVIANQRLFECLSSPVTCCWRKVGEQQ